MEKCVRQTNQSKLSNQKVRCEKKLLCMNSSQNYFITETLFLYSLNLFIIFIFVLGKPSMPEKPFVAKDIQKTELTLTWKPSQSDGGSPITGYRVEKRESWKSSWVEVDATRPGVCELTVKRLKEGQEYFFRVCAENKIGQSEFLELETSVTPKSPFCKYIVLTNVKICHHCILCHCQ